jgi:hypothetical protein
MPKLNKKMAAAAEAAEISTGDFPLLDPGYYYVQLAEVEVKDGNFAPRWSAVLSNIHHAETLAEIPGRQWYNINVPGDGPAPANYTKGDKTWANFQAMSLSQLHGFFEAFGYSTDSDTDEMVGEWAKAKVVIKTIDGGARKGEKTNEVRSLVPVEEDFDPTQFDVENDGAF